MQDIFVSERGYMPKIQLGHRIRVSRSGILYIYIYIYIYIYKLVSGCFCNFTNLLAFLILPIYWNVGSINL
jgi:hypothetical protein